ncbi:MAG: hypothetical protein N4A71_00325 [Carboxylicivirga sp.]|jgi:hypothetical protein|nr:hypothetical protein [Carboxylicivirga sp.]
MFSYIEFFDNCSKYTAADATVASVIGEVSEIENEPQTDIQE